MNNEIMKFSGDYNSYLTQAISESFEGEIVMLNNVIELLHRSEKNEVFSDAVDKEYMTSSLIGKYDIGDDKLEFYLVSSVRYIIKNKIKAKIRLTDFIYFKILKNIFNLKTNDLRYIEIMLFNTDLVPTFINEDEKEISVILFGNVIEVKECVI